MTRYKGDASIQTLDKRYVLQRQGYPPDRLTAWVEQLNLPLMPDKGLTDRPGAEGRMAWTILNPNVLEYIETGNERPDGFIWRWWSRRRALTAARASE